MTIAAVTCFHEADPGVALARRAAAEALGTLLLVFAACAAGLSAGRLGPDSLAFAIVLVALAVAAALVALIVAFGKLSGGHFNPLITMLQWLAGERSAACTTAYIGSQLLGGIVGGALAAVLWHPAPAFSGGGSGWAGILSEFVASAGLMLVVFGASRSGRAETGPFAVGAWLVAAVIATPTASYANPAVVIGAWASAGPVAVDAESVLPYVAAELAGALLALAIVSLLFTTSEPTR